MQSAQSGVCTVTGTIRAIEKTSGQVGAAAVDDDYAHRLAEQFSRIVFDPKVSCHFLQVILFGKELSNLYKSIKGIDFGF